MNGFNIKKLFILSFMLFPVAACGGSNSSVVTRPETTTAVSTVTVGSGSIRSELSYTGQVKAAEQIPVIGKLPGKIDQVFAETGDYVQAGDVLFTMETNDLHTNIRTLEAQLVTVEAGIDAAKTGVLLAAGGQMQSQILQAESGVMQAERGVEQAELAVAQRELSLDQAQIAYDNAKKLYSDTKILHEAGAASKAQIDQAEMGYTNAEIVLEQARSGYEMAAVSLEQARDAHQKAVEGFQIVSGEIPAENVRRANDALTQAESQRESLLINLEAATERLDDAQVRSPISGYVSMRNVEPQTMLNQAAPSFVVVKTDSVIVNVYVTELIINKIEPGQHVAVHINAASDEPYTGEVTIVSPAASEATLTFPVNISIDNKEGIIRPGMFAEVFFTREQADDVIIIPRAAVLVDENVPIAYVAENNRAVRKEIVTGIDNGYEIEIISGLSIGDELVFKGQTYIKDGTSIEIINEAGDF